MKQKFTELYKYMIFEGVKDLEEMYVKTGKIAPHVFEMLVGIDPTETKKYLQWMIKRAIEEHNPETLNRLKGLIPNFHQLVNVKKLITGPDSDIFQYKSIEKLYDKVKQFEEVKTGGEVEREIAAGAEKIYENDNVIVVQPKTMDASCKYGKGTKWCTAAEKSYNYFDDYYYRNSVNLYYVIPKDNVKLKKDVYSKIAVAVHPNGKKEYFDVQDRNMDEREVRTVFKDWGVPF